MRDIRRKEKAIKSIEKMKEILLKADHITIAMCKDNEPYLVSLSHGYDPEKNCIYFHCAREGKKIDFLKHNNVIWGQALLNQGYIQGKCDHKYATTQFKGRVTFVDDYEEKKRALIRMIKQFDNDPETVMKEQLTEKAIINVTIGRIDIEYMSGKKAKDAII
ncbi:MAG: pyridoxamine 5'-phosphate oxidase family protein [Candidatus Heimdallarchaeaceae archaeon]